MPEMTILGWFHTILGIGAVLTGFYAIAKFKIIESARNTGLLTLLTSPSKLQCV